MSRSLRKDTKYKLKNWLEYHWISKFLSSAKALKMLDIRHFIFFIVKPNLDILNIL